MEQYEIDRLVSDIQDFLSQNRREPRVDDSVMSETRQEDEDETGIFISPDSRLRMEWFLKYSRFAIYAVEVLTVSIFTAVMLSPLSSWPKTIMLLMGVLLFGIFTITLLVGLQARIRLLVQIESNTRQIALSKTRIADALEKIGLG
jgi:hypothetical protein